MFKRTVLSAFVVAAGVGAGLLLKVLQDKKAEEEKEYDDDEEIHFIRINDDDEDTPEPAVTVKEPAAEEPEVSPEVKEICGLYPYLKPAFVSDLLSRNSELNQAYPEDTLITLTHDSVFEDAKAAADFAEIMETAGYQCRTENEKEVFAAKKLFTEDGAIISDILNVANQAAALKGCYRNHTIQ